MSIRALARLAPALALVLLLSGCGGDSAGSDGGTTLTVYAAASLTTTFQQLGEDFERTHPGVQVRFDFGGSSDLVTQIEQGAPADVFASADTETMHQLVSAGLTESTPKPFASNTLEIAVPPGNPAGIKTFADLARPGVQLVVCAPEVPCGAAAQEMARKLGVTLHPVSEEQSVTDVLGKVSTGEADAGLVYVTDVRAAGGDVQGVPFPQSGKVVNTYPIAPVKGGDETLADQFIRLVVGATGQKVLGGAGFGRP